MPNEQRTAFNLVVILALTLPSTLPVAARADAFFLHPLPEKIKAVLKYAPLPHYPDSITRRQRLGSHTQDREISGVKTAIFKLTFDATGNVSHIDVLQRTGMASFDNACLEVLGKWQAYPGKLTKLIVPVSFAIWSFRSEAVPGPAFAELG